MATRSRIGVQLPDGTIKSVYCHWDGYKSGVGKDLKRKFRNGTNPEKVIAFIEEGSRSTVDESYHDRNGEEIDVQDNISIDSYFYGDTEEYGYLYTQDKKWIFREGKRLPAVGL